MCGMGNWGHSLHDHPEVRKIVFSYTCSTSAYHVMVEDVVNQSLKNCWVIPTVLHRPIDTKFDTLG